MPYGNYGVSWTQDDLDKVGHDIEQKAKESERELNQKAYMIRLLYVDEIKNVKEKILEEFNKTDKIKYGEVEFLGNQHDPTKDIIMVRFLIDDQENYLEIFQRVVEFVKEAIRRSGLQKFFIPKNFGVTEPQQGQTVELVFLKQNHSYERIKEKPYIVPQGEEGAEEPGGFGAEPPVDTGGFGGGGFEGGEEFGGEEPEIEAPPEEAPSPEGGGEEEV